MIRVLAYPHPLRDDTIEAEVDPGQTIREIVGNVQVLAWADGHQVPAELIERARLKSGVTLVVRPIPQGKGILRAVLSIGIAIAAAVTVGALAPATGLFTAGTFGASALAVSAGAAVGLIGTLLVNALVPPSIPKLGSGESFTRRDALTGASNRLGAFTPIPRLYGTHRIFPVIPMTGTPFTEIVGDDQYLRMLLVLGYGPLQIGGVKAGGGSLITHQTVLTGTPIKIGDTDIHAFQNVEFEIGDASAMTLYVSQIDEINPAFSTEVDLTGFGGGAAPQWVTQNLSAIRTTGVDATEISITVEYPQGIFNVNSKGSTTNAVVEWAVEYSPAGAGTWTTVQNPWSHSGPRRDTIRQGLRWSVPKGQYDVRLTRIRTFYSDFEGLNTIPASWIALRTIRSNTKAFVEPGIVTMALRIRATDQLNGVLQNLSVVGTSLLQVWNGTAWVEQATSIPAWVYADIITGSVNIRPLAKSQLNTTELLAWALETQTSGREFNAIFDSQTTVLEAMRAVTSAGRSAWTVDSDTKLSVVREVAQTIPRMVISPRNSFDFSHEIIFPRLPHALRVQFIDTNTWEDTERIVFDDGFSEANATLFETLQTRGVTKGDQAWKDGRFHLAQARLRPERYSFSQDVQHLRYRRGDLLTLAHDVILVGIAWGRIKSIVTDISNNAIQLTVDEFLTMAPAVAHGIKLQRNDGTVVTVGVANATPGSTTVDLLTPVSGLTVGDHFVFGTLGAESIDVKVLRIEPQGDFIARVTCIPAASNILDAETGAIPPFNPVITAPIDVETLPPPVPVVTSIRSDESVLVRDADGSLRVRAVVSTASLALPGSGTLIQARFQDTQDTLDYQLTPLVEGRLISLEGVEQGRSYNIQVRAVRGLLSSQWSIVQTHTVIGKSSLPSQVTGFTATAARDRVLLKWTSNPEADVEDYELREGSVWSSAVVITRTSALEFQTSKPQSGPFLIKAIDTSGNESATATTAALSIVLPAVSGLTGQVIDNNVLLRWTTTPGTFDVATHDIRRGAVFATSELIGQSAKTFDVLFERAGGAFTYWVVAIDTAGNQGTPVSIALSVTSPPDFKFFSEFMTAWQGPNVTKSNVQTTLDSKALAPFPVAETMQDKLTIHSFATPNAQIAAGFPFLAQPTPNTASFTEIYDAVAVVPSTRIDVTLDSSLIAGTLTSSITISTRKLATDPWTDFPAGLDSVFATDFQFCKIAVSFTGASSLSLSKLLELRTLLSVKLKNETGSVSVLANPTVVTFTEPFVDIESIVATPQGTVARIAVVDFNDAPNPTGFNLHLFDTNGAAATGTVRWSATGA